MSAAVIEIANAAIRLAILLIFMQGPSNATWAP